MATSSITHNFIISEPGSIERFINAIENTEKNRVPKQNLPGRELTDPDEILSLMAKRGKKRD